MGFGSICAMLEAYGLGALGVGAADGVHLFAEGLKIASADRAVATGELIPAWDVVVA